MAEVFKGRNHASFAPMQALYNLISQKVADINPVRAAKPTARERQWIYPSTPEANDESYPRVAILCGAASYSDYGPGNFVRNEKIAGNVVRIIYGRVITLPVTVTVFTKRNQSHVVTLYDGSTVAMQNTKQTDFMGDKVAKLLETYRSAYFIVSNMDIRVNSVSQAYEDNNFLHAKTISATITMFDEWEMDLTDPASTVENIANINLNVTVA